MASSKCAVVCRNVLRCVVVCCNEMKGVAVCCSVLQCVAVCCSVSYSTCVIVNSVLKVVREYRPIEEKGEGGGRRWGSKKGGRETERDR